MSSNLSVQLTSRLSVILSNLGYNHFDRKEASRSTGNTESPSSLNNPQVGTTTRPDLLSDDLATNLVAAINLIRRQADESGAWLLLAGLGGCLPLKEDVQELRYRIEMKGDLDVVEWILTWLFSEQTAIRQNQEIKVVSGAVIVDVDHSAQSALHTGVQRVVRGTLPTWCAKHTIIPVAWDDQANSYRQLKPAEFRRATQMPHSSTGTLDEADYDVDSGNCVRIIPWNTTLICLEVPNKNSSERIADLAELSTNRVVLVGYDCIPVTSADLVTDADIVKFASYLRVVKHADSILAISEAAAGDFRGFVSTLSTQGLKGPTVSVCTLPSVGTPSEIERPESLESLESPIILSVGSIEPRKNHGRVLVACERLWSEDIKFKLIFVAGSAWDQDVLAVIERLRSQGRPIELYREISEEDLAVLYCRASFSVFLSLHEGYGLPISESLAYGVPVVTSDYGAMKEFQSRGGVVCIDPRNLDECVQNLRLLLCSQTTLDGLRDAIAPSSRNSWENYADELWTLCLRESQVSLDYGTDSASTGSR